MADEDFKGWRPGKFVVRHYRRGDLLDGEAFVLVPERDPAAIHALLAYASATPDPELALMLREWVGRITDNCDAPVPPVVDKLPSWVSALAGEVHEGHKSLEQALWSITRWMLAETTNTSHGGDNHE